MKILPSCLLILLLAVSLPAQGQEFHISGYDISIAGSISLNSVKYWYRGISEILILHIVKQGDTLTPLLWGKGISIRRHKQDPSTFKLMADDRELQLKLGILDGKDSLVLIERNWIGMRIPVLLLASNFM